MKRKFIAAIIVSLLLSACGNSKAEVSGSIADTEHTSIISEANLVLTDETHKTEISSEASKVLTVSSTSETDVQTTAERYDWSSFELSEYCGEFDDSAPLKYHLCKYDDEPEIDEERFNAAYRAVINSAYYDEVTAFGKEYLEWNGSDFVSDEEYSHFILEVFPDYIDYESAPELVLKPAFESCIQMAFDGINTEEIMLFSFPLAESELEWSGTSDMIIVVYVNAQGEADVLYNVSAQTLNSVTPIAYSDGFTHLDFGSGHTSGTSRSTILSFSEGKAKVEYEGCAIRCDEEGIILRNDISGYFGHNILLFRDGLRDCYCELKAIPLPDEIIQSLIDDENVRAEWGYAAENYTDDPIYAVGGKYIAAFATAFEFDNGIIIPYKHGKIIPSLEEEGIHALNVDLNSE